MNRRGFVGHSGRILGAGWLAAQLPLVAALAACARDAARSGEPLTLLTDREAVAFGAFADLILPPDDTPGAVEAGAVHFADLALAGPFATHAETIRSGLADLDDRAEAAGVTHGFAGADTTIQDRIVAQIEDSDFFFLARMLAVMGVFSDPRYGGNRGGAGLRILGIEAHGAYSPPFGWYDAGVGATGGGA